jgi:hypothetical protein
LLGETEENRIKSVRRLGIPAEIRTTYLPEYKSEVLPISQLTGEVEITIGGPKLRWQEIF